MSTATSDATTATAISVAAAGDEAPWGTPPPHGSAAGNSTHGGGPSASATQGTPTAGASVRNDEIRYASSSCEGGNRESSVPVGRTAMIGASATPWGFPTHERGIGGRVDGTGKEPYSTTASSTPIARERGGETPSELRNRGSPPGRLRPTIPTLSA